MCRFFIIILNLSSLFTAELATKLSPENGIIRASVELLSTSDEDRPRGIKSISSSMESQGSTEESVTKKTSEETEESAGHSDAKRAKRITREEREDAMLPDLKPAPGNIFLTIVYLIN